MDWRTGATGCASQWTGVRKSLAQRKSLNSDVYRERQVTANPVAPLLTARIDNKFEVSDGRGKSTPCGWNLRRHEYGTSMAKQQPPLTSARILARSAIRTCTSPKCDLLLNQVNAMECCFDPYRCVNLVV